MKISVALCTYNGEQFIEEQLDSIFAQTLPVNEIIICDDCSTDNTGLILQKYILNYPDIIKLHHNKKALKTIKNFEKAVSLTTGDYIFLCDQDDIWKNNKVEKMVSLMEENNEILLLFSNGHLINSDNVSLKSTLWEHWKFDKQKRKEWTKNFHAFRSLLVGRNYVTGATAMIRRGLLRNAIPIEVPSLYYHDTWFALHAAAKNGLRFIDDSLINYRIHDNQQVGITAGGKNVISTICEKNISQESFIKNISEKYPYLALRIRFWSFCHIIKNRLL